MNSNPISEAVRVFGAKGILPTALDSAALRQQLSAAVRRQSLFSARTTLEGYLEDVQRVVKTILDPQDVQRAASGDVDVPAPIRVQEGIDLATARMELREKLRELGYAPKDADEAGTLTDLSSDKRIDLVVKTNQELAQGAGDFIRQNDEQLVDLYPAWELYRLEARKDERDWETRWRIAAAVANDPAAAAALELHGTMAALKSSGIWQALGDGEGGYMDTLGNPFPPFAFNSGMWTRELDRGEAEGVGLIAKGERARVNALDLGRLFGMTG